VNVGIRVDCRPSGMDHAAASASSPAPLSRLALPALAFLSLSWAALFAAEEIAVLDAMLPDGGYVWQATATLAWLAAGLTASRLLEVVVWDRVLSRGAGIVVPRLLRQMTSALILLVTVAAIMAAVYGKSVTGLLATSGAAGLVLAFALRSLILDVFSGIAMNLDRSFRTGDWVQVSLRGVKPFIGCIREVNWRTTVVVTAEDKSFVLPNSSIAAGLVLNLSRPSVASEFDTQIRIDHGEAPDRCLRVLGNALEEVRASGAILEDRGHKVRISEIGDVGVDYKISYWIDPRVTNPSKARHAVLKAALDHLQHAGITLASTLPRVPRREGPLARVELFRSLQPDELAALEAGDRTLAREKGMAVVSAGDPGESMYVLVEGLAAVEVPAPDGSGARTVARLGPGDFFGEMSLLTGAPRSATVRALTQVALIEIRKEEFAALLEARPSIAREVAEVVAARQVRNAAALAAAEPDARAASTARQAHQVLEGIRRFFSRAFAA
jgi:small-conductance mechanosensitive channel/CRP-like cAMP-binding protein